MSQPSFPSRLYNASKEIPGNVLEITFTSKVERVTTGMSQEHLPARETRRAQGSMAGTLEELQQRLPSNIPEKHACLLRFCECGCLRGGCVTTERVGVGVQLWR